MCSCSIHVYMYLQCPMLNSSKLQPWPCYTQSNFFNERERERLRRGGSKFSVAGGGSVVTTRSVLCPLPSPPPLLQDVSSELYGALMLVLSLVAVLLYGMKTSGHEVVRPPASLSVESCTHGHLLHPLS